MRVVDGSESSRGYFIFSIILNSFQQNRVYDREAQCYLHCFADNSSHIQLLKIKITWRVIISS